MSTPDEAYERYRRHFYGNEEPKGLREWWDQTRKRDRSCWEWHGDLMPGEEGVQ